MREARTQAGLGLRNLATRLDVSHSVIVRWERGERVPSPESVAALCAVLGLPGLERDRLIDLAREAVAEPSNSVSVGASGEAGQLAALLEFERIVSALTDISPVVIPGLLQTADYARAIMQGGIPDQEVDQRVMMRLGRREIITRSRSPVCYTAYLLDSALQQRFGGGEAMLQQLEFLLEMGQRDNVSIHLIPAAAGWTPAHAGPFVLLEFAKANPVVHLEHHRSSVFLRDTADVKAFVEARDDVHRAAMTTEQSSERIADVIKKME